MFKRLLILTFLLAGFTTPAFSQSPVQKSPSSFKGIAGVNAHSTCFRETANRFVTVGPDYLACFQTIKAACDYVATQTVGQFTTWRIKVFPVLEGEAPGRRTGQLSSFWSGLPIIQFSNTTAGDLITASDGGGIMNFFIYYNGMTTTSAVSLVSKPSGTGSFLLSNVLISASGNNADGFNLHLVDAQNGTVILQDAYLSRSGTATKTINLELGGSASAAIQDSRFTPGTSQPKLLETASGAVSIRTSRLDTGRVHHASPRAGREGGGIERPTPARAREVDRGPARLLHTTGTSAPAACNVGEVYVNITGAAEKICACTATNTWKCSNLI